MQFCQSLSSPGAGRNALSSKHQTMDQWASHVSLGTEGATLKRAPTVSMAITVELVLFSSQLTLPSSRKHELVLPHPDFFGPEQSLIAQTLAEPWSLCFSCLWYPQGTCTCVLLEVNLAQNGATSVGATGKSHRACIISPGKYSTFSEFSLQSP